MLSIVKTKGEKLPSNPQVILFVTLEIYPTTAGGVGILIKHTIEFLLSLGYKVKLLLDVQRHEFDQFTGEDINIFSNNWNLDAYLVDDLCDHAEFPQADIPHNEILRSARIAIAVEEICRRQKVDFVEFYDYCGSAYYFLAHNLEYSPTVAIRLHNTIELIARKIRSPLDVERIVQFPAERMSLQGADCILSPGDLYFDEEIRPLYPEIDDHKVELSKPIHRPIGEIDFRTQSNDVVFFGRLSTFKGLDIFIKAAVLALQDADFRRWIGRFLIIGPEETVASTYTLEEMKGFIPADLSGCFEFAGRLNHQETLARLEHAAFACFANRMESFCYAAHELHTAGVPLILSDTAAFRDHFEEQNQAFFFDGTPQHLAQKMRQLSTEEETRLKLSQIGKSRENSYLVDFYAQHLEASGRPATDQSGHDRDIRACVFVFSDGTDSSLNLTIKALKKWREFGDDGPDVLVATEDELGGFKFASKRWSVRDLKAGSIDPVTYSAPDIVWFVRAGDIPAENWFQRCLRLFGRRSDLGAVNGWLRHREQTHMGCEMLQPERPSVHEIGLRCAFRFNPRETLQDALRSRPNESEASLLMRLRFEGRLLLTIPAVSCDTSAAIEFGRLNSKDTLVHDFDRFQRDYMAWTLIADSRFGETQSDPIVAAEESPILPTNYVKVEAVPGSGEVHWLRLYRETNAGSSPWSAVQFNGDWEFRRHELGPTRGSYVTSSGDAAAFVKPDAALDFLGATFSGQVRISYNNVSELIDLWRQETGTVRIMLRESGPIVLESQSMAEHEFEPELQLFNAFTTQKLRQDRHDVILFLNEKTDCESIMEATGLTQSAVILSEITRGGSSDRVGTSLGETLRHLGIRKVIFSFRIEPDRRLEHILRNLPEDMQFGLVINPERSHSEYDESWQNRLARWYDCLAPYLSRLSIIGGPRGVHGFFSELGATSIPLIGLKRLEVERMVKVQSDESEQVSIAILGAEHPPQNITHMLNAIILAERSGLDLRAVYVCEAYREELKILEDLSVNLPIKLVKDSAAIVGEADDQKRILLCSYPHECLPEQSINLIADGWIPVVGEASEFADASEFLKERITQPFWEDSVQIAQKICAVRDDYHEVSKSIADYCEEACRSDDAVIKEFLLNGKAKIIHKGQPQKSEARNQGV